MKHTIIYLLVLEKLIFDESPIQRIPSHQFTPELIIKNEQLIFVVLLPSQCLFFVKTLIWKGVQ